jgi:hypothetical protein
MMDEFIRQLTHDNTQFEKQWPDTFDRLHKLSIDIPEVNQPVFKVKALDALVDYILADNEEVQQIKLTFIEITIKKLIGNPLPSLDELVRIFCRVLDVSNDNNLLNFTFLQKFYFKFDLGQRLVANTSVALINSIFISLEKHQFLDAQIDGKIQAEWKSFLSRGMFSPLSSDKNKVNCDETMINMRNSFQQLYR